MVLCKSEQETLRKAFYQNFQAFNDTLYDMQFMVLVNTIRPSEAFYLTMKASLDEIAATTEEYRRVKKERINRAEKVNKQKQNVLAQTNTPSSFTIDLTGIDDTTTPTAASSNEPVLQLLHVQPK